MARKLKHADAARPIAVYGGKASLAFLARALLALMPIVGIAPHADAASARALLALMPIVGIAPHADAASAQEVTPQSTIALDVNRAKLIQLPEAATTVFIANPDIADIQVPNAPNASNFIVFGKRAGSTTAYALSGNGRITAYAVEVQRPTGDIADAIRKQIPDAAVEVSSAPNGVTISGTARSPEDVQRMKDAARQFLAAEESINVNVGLQPSTQVTLRVRVVEVSRSTDKNFGFNWNGLLDDGKIAVGLLTGREPFSIVTNPATGLPARVFNRGNATDVYGSVGAGYRDGNVDVTGLIDALQKEGLITVLAEPNLTAISGETASFLSGGEFPVPVTQGLQQITIEWKRFGVNVDFAPTVLNANRMSIKVRPEVSELTDTGSVIINNIRIPGLAVRRAETTVELASGQSFAIAGLFQNNVTNAIQQLPGIGDMPVLGALFRSSRFQRHESELVIIVTPYIVHPAANPADVHRPDEGLAMASDIERILLGRLTARGNPTSLSNSATPRLNGAAGFMLEQ